MGAEDWAMTLDHGIPNLFAVEQTILRGGQPNKNGWAYLQSEGITRVVKLNTEEEGSDKDAKVLGMSVWAFPIPWWRQLIFRPSHKLLAQAVSVIIPGTFIHCEHGEDRTGLVVGLFRLSQGWTKEDAYAEMLAHKFHPTMQALQGRWNSENPKDWIRAG